MKIKPNQFQQKLVKTFLLVSLSFLYFNSSAQLSTYSFVASSDTIQDMSSGTTTLLGPGADDNISAPLNIGFNFTFDGASYTQFSVSSNGLMGLGPRFMTLDSVNQLTNATNNPKIAPYWDNLHTGTTGKVHYKIIGTSPNQKLCVEWFVTVPKNAALAANAKFQVWIFETSNIIEFVYGNSSTLTGIPANGTRYSVGLVKSASDFRSVIMSTSASSTSIATDTNTVAVAYKKSFKFTPPTSTTLPSCLLASAKSPAGNAQLVSTNVILTWTANLTATGAPTGYDVYFGTSSTPPIVSTNQATTNYNPGTLLGNTKYYWKVNPRNSAGIASCTKDSFTTFVPLNYNVTRTTNVPDTSISGTGTSVASWRNPLNTDDNLSNTIPIGFNFTYQGVTRTNVLISLNGFITFNTATGATGGGSGAYSPSNQSLSNDGSTGSPLTIAPFYEDLVCTGNNLTQASLDASVKYFTNGTAGSRVFTVQWDGMEIYNNTGPDLNFQVKLYEGSNNIQFVYGSMEGFNGTNNYSYSYSAGINASTVSFPPGPAELLTQQLANTRKFTDTASYNLNMVPECYSRILFTPGTYSAYVPGSTLPPNDTRATAISLPFNSALCSSLCGTYYSSAGGTASAVAACTGNPDDDVWFTFIPSDVGLTTGATIKVLSSGGYDAAVQLFDSSLNSIVCKNSSSQGGIETATAVVNVGKMYLVRVYDASTGSGTNGSFSICVSKTPPAPANDECAGAINLQVNVNAVYINGANTTTATESNLNGIQTCNGTLPDDDVWYSFVAPGVSATVEVQSNASFNAAVQVFSGTCGTLNSLQCANLTSTEGHETVVLNGLTVGATYLIRVYHASGGAGSGSFTIAVTSPLPSCPTIFNPPTGTSDIPANGTLLSWNATANALGYDVYMDIAKPPAVILVEDTPSTSVFTGPLVFVAGTTYFWQVVPRNNMGVASGCPLNQFAPVQPDVGLYLKVFIDGLYAGNHLLVPAVNADLYPNLCDTILVSLADSVFPNPILFSCKTTLATNGIAHCTFPGQSLGSGYFVVINHRNSIETWSKMFDYNYSDTLYDMTVSLASGLRMGNPATNENDVQKNQGSTNDVKRNGDMIQLENFEKLLPLYLLKNENGIDQSENVESEISRFLNY